MRVDKFLKNSRLIKRRSVAKDACQSDRIFINDKEAKPSKDVKVGDIVEIHFGNNKVKARVLKLMEHVPKDQAETMYEIIQE